MNGQSLRADLLRLYDDLAADIAAAGPVCNLSGRCCRFKEYGHTLFLSEPEGQLLVEPGLPAGSTIDENGCPFQIEGRCTARERRPLGCRIYFCDPSYAGRGEELSERYLRRLKQLHDRYGAEWEYQPLHRFLESHAAGEGVRDSGEERSRA